MIETIKKLLQSKNTEDVILAISLSLNHLEMNDLLELYRTTIDLNTKFSDSDYVFIIGDKIYRIYSFSEGSFIQKSSLTLPMDQYLHLNIIT